jgi:hypothetical protein
MDDDHAVTAGTTVQLEPNYVEGSVSHDVAEPRRPVGVEPARSGMINE